MKIDFLHGISAPNFSSTALYKAKIRQHLHDCGETTPVDVYITKLDSFDIERLKREEKDWEDTKYGSSLIDALSYAYPTAETEDKSTFYAVEVPFPNGVKQIRAIAEVTDKKKENQTHLDLIQVNNLECMPNVIKGAGSCLLYAIINHAKQNNSDFNLCSISSSMGFYRHNGLKPIRKGDSEFRLEQKNYDKRLKSLEKKYSIEKIA
ncbi:MAG: hypothetical protein K6A44_01735 [bacterium]|nr:hypothetical protein [bacterium]